MMATPSWLNLVGVFAGPHALSLDVPVLALVALILGFLGLVLTFVTFAVIVLVEAAVLRLLRWATWGRSLLDSLIMNAVSTVLGMLFYGFLIFVLKIDAQSGILQVWDLLVSWALSVVIESVVLLLLRKRAAIQTLLAMLACNGASYLMMAIVVVSMRTLS